MNWKTLTVSSSLVVGLLLQISSAEAVKTKQGAQSDVEHQRTEGAASSSAPTAAAPTVLKELAEYQSIGASADVRRDTGAARALHRSLGNHQDFATALGFGDQAALDAVTPDQVSARITTFMASYDPRADTAKVANLTRERDSEKAEKDKLTAALVHVTGIDLSQPQATLERDVQTVVTERDNAQRDLTARTTEVQNFLTETGKPNAAAALAETQAWHTAVTTTLPAVTQERDSEKAEKDKFAAALAHVTGIDLTADQAALEGTVQTVVSERNVARNDLTAKSLEVQNFLTETGKPDAAAALAETQAWHVSAQSLPVMKKERDDLVSATGKGSTADALQEIADKQAETAALKPLLTETGQSNGADALQEIRNWRAKAAASAATQADLEKLMTAAGQIPGTNTVAEAETAIQAGRAATAQAATVQGYLDALITATGNDPTTDSADEAQAAILKLQATKAELDTLLRELGLDPVTQGTDAIKKAVRAIMKARDDYQSDRDVLQAKIAAGKEHCY